jgi:hypothetical protein
MFSIISSVLILTVVALLLYLSQKKQKKIEITLSKTEQIILGSLFFCFVYLFVSGFYFSLFSTRRMYGLPLMFHIIFGCFFAVLVCAVLILYSKKFDFFDQKTKNKHKLLSKIKSALFWLFVLSGLSLVTTSFLMMIPIFIYQTQLVFFEVHRYSALVSVLTALGFLYTSISKNETPQK